MNGGFQLKDVISILEYPAPGLTIYYQVGHLLLKSLAGSAQDCRARIALSVFSAAKSKQHLNKVQLFHFRPW